VSSGHIVNFLVIVLVIVGGLVAYSYLKSPSTAA
jgi:hypothetical protein